MSEPVRLGEILPEVMQNIARRVNRYRETHNLPTLREEIRENRVDGNMCLWPENEGKKAEKASLTQSILR